MERQSWVYILAGRRDGTLYVGVTTDIARRVWEHREGRTPGFMRKYGVKRLVWCEPHDDVLDAVASEKRIKRWRRAWKLALIEKGNPQWFDQYETLNGGPG